MMKKFKIGEIVEAERVKIPEKSTQSWNTEPKSEENSMKSWVLPLLIGVVATIIYRYYFRQ
uniref:Uncharacterized protein n=2 Tax=Lutzomyia longipalpis TaxID=7200 RepID=A0A1B0CXA5_LUTLO